MSIQGGENGVKDEHCCNQDIQRCADYHCLRGRLTEAILQLLVTFHVLGKAMCLGIPGGAPERAYDMQDQMTTDIVTP